MDKQGALLTRLREFEHKHGEMLRYHETVTLQYDKSLQANEQFARINIELESEINAIQEIAVSWQHKHEDMSAKALQMETELKSVMAHETLMSEMYRSEQAQVSRLHEEIELLKKNVAPAPTSNTSSSHDKARYGTRSDDSHSRKLANRALSQNKRSDGSQQTAKQAWNPVSSTIFEPSAVPQAPSFSFVTPSSTPLTTQTPSSKLEAPRPLFNSFDSAAWSRSFGPFNKPSGFFNRTSHTNSPFVGFDTPQLQHESGSPGSNEPANLQEATPSPSRPLEIRRRGRAKGADAAPGRAQQQQDASAVSGIDGEAREGDENDENDDDNGHLRYSDVVH